MLPIGEVTNEWQHLAAEPALPEFNQVVLAQLEAMGFLQIRCQKVLLAMGNILAALSAPAFMDGSGSVTLTLLLLQWYAQAGPPAIKRAIADSPNDTASAFCRLLAGLGDHLNVLLGLEPQRATCPIVPPPHAVLYCVSWLLWHRQEESEQGRWVGHGG